MKKNVLISAILLCLALTSHGQWTYTNLSEAKRVMGSAALGNKAWFAGGNNGTNSLATVEVYDVSTGEWEYPGDLSVAREVISGAACGSKVFFAGGFDWSVSYATVDIFDTVTQQWTVEQLSVPRFSMAAVTYGSKVLFAGGFQYPSQVYKNVVDIYDILTGDWTTTYLSLAREGMAAAVVGNLALFAGGKYGSNSTTNRVDIYNFSTNTWSTATLSLARGFASATTIGNKVIIAGGITSLNNPTNRVDIYDASTNTWSISSLSDPRASQGNAATVGVKAYFAGGGNFMGSGYYDPSDVVDVYNPVNNSWTADHLNKPLASHSVLGVGNNLVVAGGETALGLTEMVQIFTDQTIIHVPGDYPTIQEGINAASEGDTVLVAENTYYENVNFMGKAILLASEFIMDGDTSHITNTIIDGSQPVDPDLGSVVTFGSGEDTTSVLCGFTITGGTGTKVPGTDFRMGGGVAIGGSGGKFLSNHIEYNAISNTGWTMGGGISAAGPVTPLPWVVLRGNRISHNIAKSSEGEGDGGGIECFYNLIMIENQISYNEANGPYRGDGGGVRIRSDFGHVELNVSNNLITHNKAVSVSDGTDIVLSGGMDIFSDVSGTVSGNIISFNEIIVADGKWSYGTGVMVDNIIAADFVFENNLISDNFFTGDYCLGGGLCIWMSNGTFLNNAVQNNTGTHGGGIAISNNSDKLSVLINNTIAGNAGTAGGGLYASSANAVVINTIIWGNSAPSGASIYEQGSIIEVRYSDVEGNDVWPGEGNINEEPLFLGDGYHLEQASPLVNQGASKVSISGELYSCPSFDIDGDARPYANTQPEIGVDEVPVFMVGVPVSTSNHSINIYPNPADQLITIYDCNRAVILEVKIYNHIGQNVYKGVPENNTLDVSKLLPGVYILEVTHNNKRFREKLIVK